MEVRTRKKTLLTPKDLRDEELKDIASQVAKDVIKLQEEGEEEMELDDIDSVEEDIQNEAKDRNEKNAFILGDLFEKNNIPYEYKITKDHEHKCFWVKPLNEDILAQEMGGGNFTVALYKTNPKRFVKQTTIRIAEPQRKASDKTESKDNTEILLKVIEDRSKAMEQNFREKEERLERDRNREREEYKAEREREREERRNEEAKRNSEEKNGKSSMIEMLDVLAKIMPKPEPVKDNSEQFYKLMMEMQKSTASMIEKMNDKSMELIKELKADTKDMIEKMKPKKEGMSDVEILMKLQETAKESKKEAKEEFFLFQELVEAKAQEKAEQMSGQPKEEKEDSVINNLISSLGPMLVQGVMKGRQQAAIQAPQAPRQVVNAPKAQTRPQPKQARPLPPQMQKRPVDSTGQNTIIGKPSTVEAEVAPKIAENVAKPTFSPMNGGHTINIPSINLEKTTTSPIIDREAEQDQVGAVISGVIMEGVQAKKPALEVSNKCYSLLSSANLVSERVFEYFPKSLLIDLRNDYSPETKDEWINEFYDNLQSRFSEHGEYAQPRYSEVN
jgi:hypothetical protein